MRQETQVLMVDQRQTPLQEWVEPGDFRCNWQVLGIGERVQDGCNAKWLLSVFFYFPGLDPSRVQCPRKMH